MPPIIVPQSMSGRWGRALRKRCDRRGSEERGKDYPSCGGDPASAWYGQYVLLDVTDVTAVKQEPNPVYIYNDPQYGLTFQWWTDADGGRAVYGNNITYNNNVLQCADEDDDTTQHAMQFVATQAGAAEINLAVIANGGVRSYKGYWVDRYQPPSPAPSVASRARLAKRPMTAAYSTGAAGASGGGYGQTIDIGSLTPDPKPNKILLPYGAVGNTYALSLNLAGAAVSDKFSWTLKAGTGKNDATNLAVITPSGATTAQFTLANLNDSDAGQQLLVTVQLTNNTAAPPVTYTLLFDIVVMQCDAISLAPTALMPVVVGAAYTQNLVAHGARDNFTWSVDASSVPPGLTWDDSSHQLSGTVTDAAQVGKAFSLVVGLAASDVIMDPLTESLGITVQSAPVVASDMPPWEKIFIYAMAASGAAILALGAFALNRYKAAKENAKTIETLKAGNANVDNATKGDPKSAGKDILQTEKSRVPTLENNVPYNQSLINEVIHKQNDLMIRINQNETTIDKLREYLEAHKRDNWDAAVTDGDLVNEGYETIGEAVEGLGDLRKSVAAEKDMLSTATEWFNQVTAKTASDQNRISESKITEPNNQRLIEE